MMSNHGKDTDTTPSEEYPALRPQGEFSSLMEASTHIYAEDIVCETNSRGQIFPPVHSVPRFKLYGGKVGDGKRIPLWDNGVSLNFRFNEDSLQRYSDPESAKSIVLDEFSRALGAWSYAVPVTFNLSNQRYDFEFLFKAQDETRGQGRNGKARYVAATSFLPNSQQNKFEIYPYFFSREFGAEKRHYVFCHELGHIFGLRHFFAEQFEPNRPVESFGVQESFTIMHYGDGLRVTEADVRDLAELYKLARTKVLTNINGTPINLVKPYTSGV